MHLPGRCAARPFLFRPAAWRESAIRWSRQPPTAAVAIAMKHARRNQSGFFLIEALVAILIFSLGILGMVALGGTAMGAQTDARYRTDAAALADELASAIVVNVDRDSDANFLASLRQFEHQPTGVDCNFSGAATAEPNAVAWLARVEYPGPGPAGPAERGRRQPADPDRHLGHRLQPGPDHGVLASAERSGDAPSHPRHLRQRSGAAAAAGHEAPLEDGTRLHADRGPRRPRHRPRRRGSHVPHGGVVGRAFPKCHRRQRHPGVGHACHVQSRARSEAGGHGLRQCRRALHGLRRSRPRTPVRRSTFRRSFRSASCRARQALPTRSKCCTATRRSTGATHRRPIPRFRQASCGVTCSSRARRQRPRRSSGAACSGPATLPSLRASRSLRHRPPAS